MLTVVAGETLEKWMATSLSSQVTVGVLGTDCPLRRMAERTVSSRSTRLSRPYPKVRTRWRSFIGRVQADPFQRSTRRPRQVADPERSLPGST